MDEEKNNLNSLLDADVSALANEGKKIRRKRKVRFIAILGALCAVGVVISLWINVEHNQRMSDIYKGAEELIHQERYDEAIEEFGKIPGYRDSDERVSRTKFLKAQSLSDAGDDVAALEIYESLGTFMEADIIAREIKAKIKAEKVETTPAISAAPPEAPLESIPPDDYVTIPNPASTRNLPDAVYGGAQAVLLYGGIDKDANEEGGNFVKVENLNNFLRQLTAVIEGYNVNNIEEHKDDEGFINIYDNLLPELRTVIENMHFTYGYGRPAAVYNGQTIRDLIGAFYIRQSMPDFVNGAQANYNTDDGYYNPQDDTYVFFDDKLYLGEPAYNLIWYLGEGVDIYGDDVIKFKMGSTFSDDVNIKDVGMYLFDADDTLKSAFGGYTVGPRDYITPR